MFKLNLEQPIYTLQPQRLNKALHSMDTSTV